MDSLTERVTRLERECRRWRAAGLMLGISMAVLITLGATTKAPDQVKASSLTIVDEKGRDRIVMDVFEDSPSLNLLDANGETRLDLIVLKNGNPFIDLMDRKGKNRLSLCSGVEDVPVVSLRDDQEKTRMMLTISPKTGPHISFHAPDGKQVSRLP